MPAAFSAVVTATQLDTAATLISTSSFSVSSGTTLVASLMTRAEQTDNMVVTGGGLSWTFDHESLSSGTGTGGHVQTAYAHANAATSVTVSSSFSTTGGYNCLAVATYTNGDSTTIAGNSSNARNTGNTQAISVPSTIDNDSSLNLSWIGSGSDSGTYWNSSNAPASWNFRTGFGTGGTAPARCTLSLADHLVTSAGNDSHTWSSDGVFHNSNNVVTTEVLEGGAAPPPVAAAKRLFMLMGVGQAF